ncbi:hypothetical protein FXO38_23896 [Capsicum annuum]|uniref:FAF domain-containing protein n=1 Tax=Capsicum annuum TaxID=4072 RepID=A0A2G3AIA1_CAPAN|nr:protein FAF-like, chloroplastic [Capsicum annuum]KAF3637035.1 hypothetical protein FXO38_23896 [Capsicum annuum]PHT93971.1 hypothetical protein T459_01853 [Capsicum annuum]
MSTTRTEAVATPQLSKAPTPPLPKTNIVKQGIVSILGSDSQRGKSSAASIRRTFSADMSSKQWLAQNGFFSPIKKIASSKDLLSPVDHSSSEEEKQDELERRKTSFDVWSSILSQKKDDGEISNVQTPYIHPLVKRSLSEKSLEICTENLGSENGSDGFSSNTPSENGDIDEDKYDQQQQQYCSRSIEELRVVKYKYSKRSSSFPPPIPSLARGDNNKPSLHMQSRRKDGRLILEAVPIPSRNLFQAHRHDGRLLLTFVDNSTSTLSSEPEMGDYGEEFDQVFDDIDDHTPRFDYKSDDSPQQKEEHVENGIVVMKQKPKLSSGVINMMTSALMMKLLDSPIEIREKSIQYPTATKFPNFSPEPEGQLGLGNKNLVTWSNKFNEVVNLTSFVDSTELTKEVSQIASVPQSLHTQPTPATTATFNAYEYFWRKNPTIASIVNTPTIAKKCNNYTTKQVVLASNSTSPNAKGTTKVAAYEQHDLMLMRGNKVNMNYLVPLQRGCKETRRSFLIWEPYCIATS